MKYYIKINLKFHNFNKWKNNLINKLNNLKRKFINNNKENLENKHILKKLIIEKVKLALIKF